MLEKLNDDWFVLLLYEGDSVAWYPFMKAEKVEMEKMKGCAKTKELKHFLALGLDYL